MTQIKRISKCFHMLIMMSNAITSGLFVVGVAGQEDESTAISCSAELLTASDVNGDGYLDESEYRSYLEVVAPIQCSIYTILSDYDNIGNRGILLDVWDIATCFCLQFNIMNDPYCCGSSYATVNNSDRQLAIPNGLFYPEPLFSSKICQIFDQAVLDECSRFEQPTPAATTAIPSAASGMLADTDEDTATATTLSSIRPGQLEEQTQMPTAQPTPTVPFIPAYQQSNLHNTTPSPATAAPASSSTASSTTQLGTGSEQAQTDADQNAPTTTTQQLEKELFNQPQQEPLDDKSNTTQNNDNYENNAEGDGSGNDNSNSNGDDEQQQQLEATNTTASNAFTTQTQQGEDHVPYIDMWKDIKTIVTLIAVLVVSLIFGIACVIDKKLKQKNNSEDEKQYIYNHDQQSPTERSSNHTKNYNSEPIGATEYDDYEDNSTEMQQNALQKGMIYIPSSQRFMKSPNNLSARYQNNNNNYTNHDNNHHHNNHAQENHHQYEDDHYQQQHQYHQYPQHQQSAHSLNTASSFHTAPELDHEEPTNTAYAFEGRSSTFPVQNVSWR